MRPEPSRLAPEDPFVVVAQARAERGRHLASFLRGSWRNGRRPGLPARRWSVRFVPIQTLAGGYMLSYLFRNINGIIGPEIVRDLHLGADTLGLLTSIGLLVFAAAQLPIGSLLDRFGPARVQSALLLCAAAGAGLSAAGGGFAGLLAGRALIGLGTAGCFMAGLKATAIWVPRQRLARVNGLLVMSGGVGAMLATWPAELALRVVDWRVLLAVLALVAAGAAVATHRLVPDVPAPPADRPPSVSLAEIVRDRLFQRVAPLSASCFGTVLALQGLWAGPWLADVDRLSRADVAGDLACMAAVLIVAAPCWGAVTQWLRPRIRLSSAAAVTAVAMLGVEALLLAHPGRSSVLPWCALSVFGGMTVLSYGILAEHFPTASIGRANAALNVGHIGMSFAIQYGVGIVVAWWAPDAGHYPAAAYRAGLLLPIAVQLAALVWFVCPRSAAAESPTLARS